MSESDDTDILLLIPPNFFSIKDSDEESTHGHHYYNVSTILNDIGSYKLRETFYDSDSEFDLKHYNQNRTSIDNTSRNKYFFNLPQENSSSSTLNQNELKMQHEKMDIDKKKEFTFLEEINDYLKFVKQDWNMDDENKETSTKDNLSIIDPNSFGWMQNNQNSHISNFNQKGEQSRYEELDPQHLYQASPYMNECHSPINLLPRPTPKDDLHRHLEIIINTLNQNILEDQEKISSLIHINKEKDQSIIKLQAAWNHLLTNLKQLANQYSMFVLEIKNKEIYYKEIINQLEQKNTSLNSENNYKQDQIDKMKIHLSKKDNKIEHLKAHLKKNSQLRQEINDIIKNKEELEKKLEEQENENQVIINNLKQENHVLQKNIDKLKKNILLFESKAESNITILRQENDTLKSKEKNLNQEINGLKNNLKKIKDYYQNQIDEALEQRKKAYEKEINKLKKFFNEEIEKKNKELHTATQKLQVTCQSYKLEINKIGIIHTNHTEYLTAQIKNQKEDLILRKKQIILLIQNIKDHLKICSLNNEDKDLRDWVIQNDDTSLNITQNVTDEFGSEELLSCINKLLLQKPNFTHSPSSTNEERSEAGIRQDPIKHTSKTQKTYARDKPYVQQPVGVDRAKKSQYKKSSSTNSKTFQSPDIFMSLAVFNNFEQKQQP